MWNWMPTIPLTEIVLGLIPSADVGGVTVTVTVFVAPRLSMTVMVTAVVADTVLGFTVKVLPTTVASGTTAVLFEKAVAPYVPLPPDMMKVTLSAALAVSPVTDTEDGFTVRGPPPITVIAADVAPPTESSTFKVIAPVPTFAGKVTVTDGPVQTPTPGVVLNALDGSVEVVT
jgi:hypothetical protein